jgi:hypothetical protein
MKSEFIYRYGLYPDKSEIVDEIADAALRLDQKLAVLDIEGLGISEYNARYFGGHIVCAGARKLNLTKYGYVLAWAIAHLEKDKDELVFLDYGGGHGMLSLLAKEYEIGTVVHNDIYSVSCDDAKTIGIALGLEADDYFPGDIDTVLKYFSENRIVCDSVANYDVIEHIYDIDGFLKKLHLLSPGPMSIFLASAANERNPRINRMMMKLHREFENKDRAFKTGRKPTDATKAIIELRRNIIVKYAPSLSSAEVDKLAVLTRGLVVRDIQEKLDEYRKYDVFPPEPSHPTNTCDPYNGNWFEHLMNPEALASVLDSTGFNTTIKCGFYDQPKNLPRRWVKLVLNVLIRIMGKQGLFFAPFFALSARK